jgi:glycosyltransferase involved in cell wall biosynthesis
LKDTIKVCMITSVHKLYDTRIFYKECKSLLSIADEVNIIVQHEKDEKIEGINICAIDVPKNRRERIKIGMIQLYRKALQCNADIYHFHDPELIPVGLRLKKNGKKVIYDVHEDLPRDIYYKPWIPKCFKPLLSRIAEKIEAFAAKRFDAVITSTPYIAQRFNKYTDLVVDVKNYPLITEDINPVSWTEKDRKVCFISSNFVIVRAIREVIKAMQMVNGNLTLAGNLTDEALKRELSAEPGWKQVNLLGWVNRQQVVETMKKSVAGLSLYYPTATNSYAIPTKMFEYMMAGIPVIASNLPYESEIINKHHCGICVDPFSPEQIAEAMNWILDNPKEAEQMGLNGRRAVETEYNWKTEELKLLSLYRDLVG